MPEEPAYIVDIDDLKGIGDDSGSRRNRRSRWLGVRFDCCSVYLRIYKNAAGTAYVGHCPKCCRPVTIRVGPGGTSQRFFRAI